jgi:hypothetical protein
MFYSRMVSFVCARNCAQLRGVVVVARFDGSFNIPMFSGLSTTFVPAVSRHKGTAAGYRRPGFNGLEPSPPCRLSTAVKATGFAQARCRASPVSRKRVAEKVAVHAGSA